VAVLSAAKIKAANDKKIKTVEVPEWGGEVCIKTMSGFDRDAIGEAQDKKEPHFIARFLSLVLCDESGERLFPGDDGVKALGEKANAVLSRLFEQGWEHNVLSPEAVEKLGEPSPGAPSESSS
jgi:hypothetical protein